MIRVPRNRGLTIGHDYYLTVTIITMTTVGLHPRHQGHNASGRSGKRPSQDYLLTSLTLDSCAQVARCVNTGHLRYRLRKKIGRTRAT